MCNNVKEGKCGVGCISRKKENKLFEKDPFVVKLGR